MAIKYVPNITSNFNVAHTRAQNYNLELMFIARNITFVALIMSNEQAIWDWGNFAALVVHGRAWTVPKNAHNTSTSTNNICFD